jgi:8-oxo-dGTP pyrophosphatase MutT (NUDIX family)
MPPVDDAATVILLRDGPDGPEVFLQRRGAGAAFMAGAYVFPGGKVDDTDRGMPPGSVADPGADHLPLRVAALREAFEEAGVLLGTRDGSPIDGRWLASESATTARRRLHDRSDPFDWRGWLASEHIVLATDALALATRWITPEAEPRRFDTWFFRAQAPDDQDADHDDVEMTDSLWLRPAAALEAADRGSVLLVPPTRKNLEALVPFATTRAAVDDARSTGSPEPILPVIEARDDGSVWVSHDSFDPMRVR